VLEREDLGAKDVEKLGTIIDIVDISISLQN